jgi:hypothetical protein
MPPKQCRHHQRWQDQAGQPQKQQEQQSRIGSMKKGVDEMEPGGISPRNWRSAISDSQVSGCQLAASKVVKAQ